MTIAEHLIGFGFQQYQNKFKMDSVPAGIVVAVEKENKNAGLG